MGASGEPMPPGGLWVGEIEVQAGAVEENPRLPILADRLLYDFGIAENHVEVRQHRRHKRAQLVVARLPVH